MKHLCVSLALLLLSGCACRDENGVSLDSYQAALRQIQANLVDDTRPAMEEAFSRADPGYPEEYEEAVLGVIDDTLELIDETLRPR